MSTLKHGSETAVPWALRPESTALLFTLGAALLSVFYGLMMAGLPSEQFKDWSNYLEYAEISSERIELLWQRGLLAFLANEPVWLLFNAVLYNFFSADTVVRLFVFFPAMVVAWIVLTRNRGQFALALLILLLPLVMKNHLTHVRQGVAIAFFLLGYFSGSKGVRFTLILITPFIHASFFFVLMVMYCSFLLGRERAFFDVRIAWFAGLGLFIGVSLGWLSGMLGARQANEYQFSATQVSGLGFVFWAVVVMLMLGEGRVYFRKYAFEASMIVFYLSTYFLVEVTGRIFESVLLLILFAGLDMTGLRRLLFVGAVLSLGVQQWLVRSSQPLLGFGIS